MERKISINGNSYQVVIPKFWIEANNLNTSLLLVIELDKEGNLILKKPEVKE